MLTTTVRELDPLLRPAGVRLCLPLEIPESDPEPGDDVRHGMALQVERRELDPVDARGDVREQVAERLREWAADLLLAADEVTR